MFDQLKRQLLVTEDRVLQSSHHAPARIAAFDLDGTLLIGDMGDAVFAYLILEHHHLKLTWTEYQRLLHTNRSQAYRSVVEAMAGLDVEVISQATSAVMNFGKDYIIVGSDRVRTPKPRPLLSQFVGLLQELQYEVYIVSASNHISVQHVAKHWFNIPPTHAFGIQGRIRGSRITSDLVSPVPIGAGKADLFTRVAGPAIPLITGTDSTMDLPLLRLTHPEGFSLWVGDDHSDYEVAIQNARAGHKFFFVGSGEDQQPDEF
jgi:phosphoserine phosphatase